jgi:hypothetical protein
MPDVGAIYFAIRHTPCPLGASKSSGYHYDATHGDAIITALSVGGYAALSSPNDMTAAILAGYARLGKEAL